jgi:hypothetical protein
MIQTTTARSNLFAQVLDPANRPNPYPPLCPVARDACFTTREWYLRRQYLSGDRRTAARPADRTGRARAAAWKPAAGGRPAALPGQPGAARSAPPPGRLRLPARLRTKEIARERRHGCHDYDSDPSPRASSSQLYRPALMGLRDLPHLRRLLSARAPDLLACIPEPPLPGTQRLVGHASRRPGPEPRPACRAHVRAPPRSGASAGA